MFECPFCGFTGPPPRAYPVHCRCGLVMDRGGVVLRPSAGDHAPVEVQHVRYTRCLFCEYWMGGHRCQRIAEGCRVAFYVALYSITPECDRWER